jgi:hypothetical protein
MLMLMVLRTLTVCVFIPWTRAFKWLSDWLGSDLTSPPGASLPLPLQLEQAGLDQDPGTNVVVVSSSFRTVLKLQTLLHPSAFQ